MVDYNLILSIYFGLSYKNDVNILLEIKTTFRIWIKQQNNAFKMFPFAMYFICFTFLNFLKCF